MKSSCTDRPAGPLFVCALFAFLTAMVFANPARAQDRDVPVAPAQSTETADEQILKGLERAKADREGLVIVSAELQGRACGGIDVEVTRNIGGRHQNIIIPGMHKFFGSVVKFRPKGLGAGEWYIVAVKCNTRPATVFTGTYAKFEVQPGEVVDVGTLKIDYTEDPLPRYMFTGGGVIRLSVQPNSEARMAHLKTLIPRVMARVKKRPMVLVGAAEQKVKMRGGL
jgi:hypothetical protein